jgi:hypothetical protein
VSEQANDDPPKRVTQTVTPVESVPWYRSPQVLIYGAGVVTGPLAILRSFGITVFKDAGLEMVFAGGIVGTLSCAYALYRRWKAGRDPKNPTPKLTA